MPRKKKSVVKQADELFGKIIRARGRCEMCGAGPEKHLQCAHTVSRRYRSIRWDEENAFCLCKSDHLWGTLNPLEWEEWVIEQIGQEKWDDLRVRARQQKVIDYDELIPHLKQRLMEVNG